MFCDYPRKLANVLSLCSDHDKMHHGRGENIHNMLLHAILISSNAHSALRGSFSAGVSFTNGQLII